MDNKIMKKNSYNIGIILFIIFILSANYSSKLKRSYHNMGKNQPTSTYSTPLNERGNIKYITSRQNQNLNILMIMPPVIFILSSIFLYKGGIPFNTREGLDKK